MIHCKSNRRSMDTEPVPVLSCASTRPCCIAKISIGHRLYDPLYINAPADSHVCAGLQCDGRLTRPPPWPTQRPSGLLLLRLTRPTAPAYDATAGSPVSNFIFTAVIINSAVDNYWPDASGDIHPSLFLLSHVVFVKEQVYLCLGLQYCLCRANYL